MVDSEEGDKVSCPHHPDKAYVLVDGQLICPVCGRHSQYQHIPDYAKLLNQNSILCKILEDICECQEHRNELIEKEDICECQGNLDELIDKARRLLQTL